MNKLFEALDEKIKNKNKTDFSDIYRDSHFRVIKYNFIFPIMKTLFQLISLKKI